jgi:hypothetical protein
MVQCAHGSGNRMIDIDCGVHLMVDDATVETQYGTAVKIKFSVLGCTDPKQVGKSHTEIFNVDDGRVDMFLNIAEACGLITAQQRKDATDAGVGLDVNETLLKGRQLCGLIKMELKQRKNPATGQYEVDPEKPGPFPRLAFRTFGVFDAKAKDIPKDQKFLAMLQAPPGQHPVQHQVQRPSAPAQAPAATTAPAASMKW